MRRSGWLNASAICNSIRVITAAEKIFIPPLLTQLLLKSLTSASPLRSKRIADNGLDQREGRLEFARRHTVPRNQRERSAPFALSFFLSFFLFFQHHCNYTEKSVLRFWRWTKLRVWSPQPFPLTPTASCQTEHRVLPRPHTVTPFFVNLRREVDAIAEFRLKLHWVTRWGLWNIFGKKFPDTV